MIHYSCDLCKRKLDPTHDVRYVVKLEIGPAFEPCEGDELDDDRDNLHEINEMLERMDDLDELDDQTHHHLHYDLCADCRKRVLRDPLGRDAAKQFHFSQN